MRPESTRCKKCRKLSGEDHPHWKGGRFTAKDGYVRVWVPDDPRANMGRYLPEHRVVMERVIGRQLRAGESVHHRNGIRSDNRPENLELWVVAQPAGQRVDDVLAWAREIIRTYGQLAHGSSDAFPEMTAAECAGATPAPVVEPWGTGDGPVIDCADRRPPAAPGDFSHSEHRIR